MVIRIYIEGGATGRTANQDFRRGWKKVLNELHELARAHGFNGLDVVRGKSRSNTFRRFTARRSEFPLDLSVLLVDSECPVAHGSQVWNVVQSREGDNWEKPQDTIEGDLFLMVQSVETWLLTDQQALQQFFGRGFRPNALPTTNLETRTKTAVERALIAATRETKKGPYRHGQAHEILEGVQPNNIKQLFHGRRLFEVMAARIMAS